jgi:hypothetical protein
MIIHGQVDVNQAIFKNYFSIWSHVSTMMPYDGGHLDILG